jgi:hypothetical protein
VATESDRPLDQLVDTLLDVAVYAPIGLVMLAREEIPKLAAQGRQRVESQAGVARMVGKLAVAQGRRQAQSVVDRLMGKSGEPSPVAEEQEARPRPRGAGPAGRPRRAAEPVAADEGAERLPVVVGETVPDVAPQAAVELAETALATAPEADDLPIPGYDSLSASQVVQRLPGLSPAELEAVRAYEQAGRARKTVLLRVAQLRAS